LKKQELIGVIATTVIVAFAVIVSINAPFILIK